MLVVKKQKALTFSLIIPVYNEENYLEACLQSITSQSVKPLEVIVVDNNSSDNSVKIAKRFDFVRVISEKRQHQSYAQYAGFERARGDILGRIDADSILPTDWVKKNLAAFNHQPSLLGVTGSGRAYDIVLSRIGELLFNFYYRIAYKFAGHKLMWGANCAFRRDAWPRIKKDLLLRPDIWEDYDLGFCLAKHGRIDKIDNPVGVSYRTLQRPLYRQIVYQARSIRTFYIRKGSLRAIGFFLAWSTAIMLIPLIIFDYHVLRPAKSAYLIRVFLDRLAIVRGII